MGIFQRSFFNAQTKKNEVVASVYEKVIDEIGLENITMLVPGWEQSGDTLSCMINPEIKFKASTPPAVMNYAGLLHPVPRFESANSGFTQETQEESTDNSSSDNMLSSEKLATKLNGLTVSIGLVRLHLARAGSLGSASIRVAIYTGNPTPDNLVGTSNSIPAATVATSGGWEGFTFDTAPKIDAGQTSWIVLEYADDTGVDGSNYISWSHDGGANSYGRDRATFDGAVWSVASDQNHAFYLYDDALLVTDDFTIITSARYNYTVFSSTYPLQIEAINASYNHFRFNSNDYVTANAGLTGVFSFMGRDIYKPINYWKNNNHVYTTQFSKGRAEGKYKAYLDGRKVVSADDQAGDGYPHYTKPIHLGREWVGPAGPFIITSNFMTEAAIARVANLLLTVRRLESNV